MYLESGILALLVELIGEVPKNRCGNYRARFHHWNPQKLSQDLDIEISSRRIRSGQIRSSSSFIRSGKALIFSVERGVLFFFFPLSLYEVWSMKYVWMRLVVSATFWGFGILGFHEKWFSGEFPRMFGLSDSDIITWHSWRLPVQLLTARWCDEMRRGGPHIASKVKILEFSTSPDPLVGPIHLSHLGNIPSQLMYSFLEWIKEKNEVFLANGEKIHRDKTQQQ